MFTDTPNIVFLDKSSLSVVDLSFATLYDTFPSCAVYEKCTDDEVTHRIRNADIVISNKSRLHADAIAKAHKLRMISIMATGYNNVDIDAARRHNITVTNVRSYGTASVVQHVFMLILNLATRFVDYHGAVQKGQWNTSKQFCLLDYNIMELYGKTLGIIGYGELGQAVERTAQCFGLKTLVAEHKNAHTPRTGRTAFDEVIATSDIITLHCPLNDMTCNMIDTPELSAMKHSAFLINTARGGIVNEAALKEALVSERIAGAGVDVLLSEPPVNGNILLDSTIPNLIITPHTAWASLEAQQRLFDNAIYNVINFIKGSPTNVVS